MEAEMNTRSLLLALSLLALFVFAPVRADEIPSAKPEDVGLSSERLARFSAAMEKGVEAGHLPGVVAGVVRNGQLAFLTTWAISGSKEMT